MGWSVAHKQTRESDSCSSCRAHSELELGWLASGASVLLLVVLELSCELAWLKVQLLLVVDLVSKSHWAYHLLLLGVPAVLEVALS